MRKKNEKNLAVAILLQVYVLYQTGKWNRKDVPTTDTYVNNKKRENNKYLSTSTSIAKYKQMKEKQTLTLKISKT
jgi:hypothetical protein